MAEKGGVVLAVEGFDEFILRLNQANEALAKFSANLEGVSQPAAAATVAIQGTESAVSKGAETLQGAESAFSSIAKTTDVISGATNKYVQAQERFNAAIPDSIRYTVAQEEAIRKLEEQDAKAAEEFWRMIVAQEKEKQASEGSAEAAKKQATAVKTLSIAMLGLGAAGKAAALGAATVASRIEELEILLEVSRVNAIGLAQAQAETAKANFDSAAADEALARAANLTSEAVQAQVQGIRDLHLSGLVANQTVAMLIRYNLDWSKATDLARLAQDSATYAMQDSSKALEGLINGITTLQPRVLRTYGLFVNLEVAYEKFAKANGVAVESMTVTQRQQAALNEVLAQAPSIQGAYTAAMGTAAKQMRSIKTDLINLSEAYGESLTPALTTGVSAFRGMLQTLTAIDPVARATIATTGATASGILLLGGSVLALLPRLAAMAGALKTVTGATTLAGASVMTLIPALGLLAAVGVVSYLKAQEEAHIKEAAAVAESSKTYNAYISQLDSAKVSAYGLTRGLYELVKAQQESAQEAYAKALAKTFRALMNITADAFGKATLLSLGMGDAAQKTIEGLTAMQLVVLQDRDAVYELGTQIGLSGEELQKWVILVMAATRAEELHRQEVANYTDFEKERYKILLQTMNLAQQTAMIPSGFERVGEWVRAAKEVNSAFEDFADNLSDYVTPEVRKLADEFRNLITEQGLIAALDKTEQMMLDIVAESEEKIDDLRDEARRDSEKAEADHLEEEKDLYQDYLDDRTESLAEFQRDRIELEQELTRTLVELEQQLALDREEAYRDFISGLEDIDRQYAQDREDAARDLARDLEDLDRELAQDIKDERNKLLSDLEDMEAEHQKRLLALTEQYGEKRASIEAKYAELRADIEKKYQVAQEVDREAQRDEERESLLTKLRELLAMEDAYRKQGYARVWEERIAELQAQLDALKQEELSALEERKDAELAELANWLAEQQAKEDEAYAKARAARQVEYDERLAELQTQHRREEEERRRDYERQMEDLAREHERQRAENERAYQQKLADLDRNYALERAKVQAKYQQDLADLQAKLDIELAKESANYAKRKAALDEALAKEKAAIATNLEAETTKVQEETKKQMDTIIKAWYDVNPLVATAISNVANNTVLPLFDKMLKDLLDKFNKWIADMQNAAAAAGFTGKSPAPWWKKMGESWSQGLQAGTEGLETTFQDTFSSVENALKAFNTDLAQQAFSANVAAAINQRATIPNQITGAMSMPPVGGSTRNTNLTVNASYSRYQSEASLRQDLAMYQQMMRRRQQ